MSSPVCAALARPGCGDRGSLLVPAECGWPWQPEAVKVESEGPAELSRYTGAPADTWHAVTRAGEARERPSLGTSMEDMMSHHKPFPYLLGAMIGT